MATQIGTFRQITKRTHNRGRRSTLRLDRLEDRTVPSSAHWLATGAGETGGPHVKIFDAANGALQYEFSAYDPAFTGGVRVAIANVTGDQTPDVITGPGAGGGPVIRVFDGATRQMVREFNAFDPAFRGGVKLTAADFDGDGKAEIVVAPDVGGGPVVRVFDGATYSMITEFNAYDPNFRGGVNIAVGEVTNDGIPDIVTGAGFGGGPHVKVFDGSSLPLTVLARQFFAYDQAFRGGVYVAVTIPSGSIEPVGRIVTGPGEGGGPHVKVFDVNSGPNPVTTSSFLALPSTFTGGLRVGSTDITGDGRGELVIAAGRDWSSSGGVGPYVVITDAAGVMLRSDIVYALGFKGGVFPGAPIGPTFVGTKAYEGSTAQVSFANLTDDTNNATFSYDFNADGVFEITGSTSPTATVPANYLADGPGSRVVRGQIQYGSGSVTEYKTAIPILNAPPTVQAGGPYTGAPGTAISFAATVTDPSPVDTAAGFTYTWNFGDGSATSTQAAPSHVYTAVGTYTVSLTVRDKDNGSATATATVTVTATSLQATFSGSTANEGSTGTVSFSNPTGGTGGYRYSYDFNNDGTFEITDSTSLTATVPASYLSDGPGSRVVRGRIKDSIGTFTDYTAPITILNVPPSAQVGGPYSGAPGTAISFAATVTDPSPVDTAAGFTYTWNFGDGTATSSQAAPNHVYATAGTYTVSLTVRDKDNGSATATATVTVTNANLTASFAGGNANEGSTGTVTFSNPAGGSGGYRYSYDFNNDGTFEITDSTALTATVPASYLADGPGSRVVRGRIKDSIGTFADYTAPITIANVPPTVQAGGPYTGSPGTAINFAATVTDPSPVDTAAGFTYTWNFGDGTASSNQAAPSHVYTTAGTYTVSLTVRDKDNGSATATATVTVTNASLQATFTGGNANEGSTGTVTFSNPTGGSGGYRYSYDFNNDGTFEITDSTALTATVPASYLADGPGSRVVRGRIKDSIGTFTDYTAPITIANVPPTVQAGGPYTGSPGTAINFAATVTDPSPVDTAAGFTYTWNFGDGTATSSQAAPNHIFATAGTYVVNLTVRDKDNGSATATATVTVGTGTTSFIVTPFDRIPNFGANPTVTAVANGNWSNPTTWSGNQVPAAGAIVAIPSNRTVVYDLASDVAINTVAVQPGGMLRFRTDMNTRLTVVNLLIMQGGALEIGTAASTVAANVKAEVIFPDQALNTAADPEQYGNGLIALGKVTIHGAVKNDSFLRLASEPMAGQNMLTLAQPAVGWQVGDRLVLPDSRQQTIETVNTTISYQYEEATIAAISSDGLTLTLSTPLQFNHPGARDGNGTLALLPHVGNRTRNVVLRSASSVGTRGHVYLTYRADADIRYAGFGGLGRTTIDVIDNTTFDASGIVTHVGTNVDNRFAVNFSHLFGPTVTPANGFQFTFVGNAVFCAMSNNPFKWGVTINDSHYGLIQDNFIYNWGGAGLVTKQGNESYNVIADNFALRGIGRGDREGSGQPGNEGMSFWFRGPNNYVRDNVGANYTGNSVESTYGFKYFFSFLGNIRVPNFPGADTSISNQVTVKDGNAMPILAFERNEAYGVENALTIWWLNTYNTHPNNGGNSVVKDFRGWHNTLYGYYGYQEHDITFDGYVIYGDRNRLANGAENLIGMWFGDYNSTNVKLIRANIQGTRVGFIDPYYGGTTTTIEDSYFRNSTNIQVRTLGAPGMSPNANYRQPKTLVVRNVTHGSTTGWNLGGRTPWDIDMAFMDQNGSSNYIQSDRVFVYDHNGVTGVNFQVFYNEQAPGFIVPQTGGNQVGSPVAGLTNQQNWSQYQVAIAGAVATNTTTRPGVRGLTRGI